MKQADPTPEEYVNYIMNVMFFYVKTKMELISLTRFVITELRENSTSEINRLYFNECLTELKKL